MEKKNRNVQFVCLKIQQIRLLSGQKCNKNSSTYVSGFFAFIENIKLLLEMVVLTFDKM